MDTNRHELTCGLETSTSESTVPSDPIARFLRLIRFSHTIFALPFALGALFVAANGWPSLRILLLVIACMVFARTAAMLFNRLVDWSLDQRNPRTASRHLLVSKLTVQVFLVLSSVGFILAAAEINRLTCILAPIALAVIFFYSLTKRFTSATHFFLGLALAISPIGAWIAQTGRIDLAPVGTCGGRDLLGRRVRSHLCDAGLRFRSARRYSVARGEARDRAKSPNGSVAASAHVCSADWFWRHRKARCGLLLVPAADRGSARLRTQNRETRSCWNQSRIFSEQRIC